MVFIDEIHRLPPAVEEVLYGAMEDRAVDVLVGSGPAARTIRLDLPHFTLIGATTRAGALSSPLRDRFGIIEHLDFYSTEALTQILMRSARLLGAPIHITAATLLASRSRGTPRIANQLLRRVLDFALVEGVTTIDPPLVEGALQRLGVDTRGLGRLDREFLGILRDRYRGGPVGLEAMAAAMNEERSTLEDVLEPFLVSQGFLLRTPRGRALSPLGRRHLDEVGGLWDEGSPAV